MYLGCLGIAHVTHGGFTTEKMLREGPNSCAVPGEPSRVCGHFCQFSAGPGWARLGQAGPRVQELGIVSKWNPWVREAGAPVTTGTCGGGGGGGESMPWAIR